MPSLVNDGIKDVAVVSVVSTLHVFRLTENLKGSRIILMLICELFQGNDVRMLHNSAVPPSPSSKKEFRVRLVEADWERQDRQRMSREYLLMALANVEYILIRASFGDGSAQLRWGTIRNAVPNLWI